MILSLYSVNSVNIVITLTNNTNDLIRLTFTSLLHQPVNSKYNVSEFHDQVSTIVFK